MKNIDAVLQYMNWAMIVAHAEANPDCRKVRTEYDLENRVATTSYVLKTAEDESTVNSALLAAVEAVHTALTGLTKFNREGCIKLLRKVMDKARAGVVRVPKTTSLGS